MIVFDEPDTLAAPAPFPKNELELPVVAVPAPANTLPVPLMLKTRLPAILKFVAELTTLADKVPPRVPLPEMLKLPGVCSAVPFWM